MTAFQLVMGKWKVGDYGLKTTRCRGENCEEENGIWMVLSSLIICTDKGTNLLQKEQGKYSSFPQVKLSSGMLQQVTRGFTFFILISNKLIIKKMII